jgi:hypothetical protein
MEASGAEIARRQAEARRQKILARQKDRLTAITGVYSHEAGAAASGERRRRRPRVRAALSARTDAPPS